MSYMWNEFNIKTFAAETIVYRDGVYCPELSTLENVPINKTYDLPVHVIYVGEISGDNKLEVLVGAENQKVIVTAKIKNNLPAFFNILIKNAGKNSEITAGVFLENNSRLTYDCRAEHLKKKTAVLIKNKLLAGKNSFSQLSGVAVINRDCDACNSDVGFVAMAEQGARIDFRPEQRISSVPKSAEHSAAIYKPSDAQIFYLRGAGLSGAEVDTALKEAFMNDYE